MQTTRKKNSEYILSVAKLRTRTEHQNYLREEAKKVLKLGSLPV